MKTKQRILSVFLCLVIIASVLVVPPAAHADFSDALKYSDATVKRWLGGENIVFGGWTPMGYLDSLLAVNQPKKYYTTPTSSTVDRSGNVTNYYRSGDTTNTKIIDSYNKTFNTIHNTNSTTNNYKANVELSNFLNQYTTNNTTYNNTYSANFKSWYYDNTTNNYNYTTFNKNDYTQNNLYYNQDNSRYYISIDNSKDEYYLIDVQYSPTFVTVNYTYNTTNNNYKDVGDVTNVYYYELEDGRNSSTLTASEVAGIDLKYNVKNYELITDDPNTLSLQHFDGNYTDSSSFNRSYFSQNRSSTCVDSGAFGKAVSLPNGSVAGMTIPSLSGCSSLSFDFRVYYNIADLGIYFGSTNLLQEIPATRTWTGQDIYSDNGDSMRYKCNGIRGTGIVFDPPVVAGNVYTYSYLDSIFCNTNRNNGYNLCLATDKISTMTVPSSYSSSGYTEGTDRKYGLFTGSTSVPSLHKSTEVAEIRITDAKPTASCSESSTRYLAYGAMNHYLEKEYRWTPSGYVAADFPYDSYRDQWVSMRITLKNNKIYYFVNGDLVGSGAFTKSTANDFY